MTRPAEYHWINDLSPAEKARLNELIRVGCLVRVANHSAEGVRVSMSYRRNLICETVAPDLTSAFNDACLKVDELLFGHSKSNLRG